LGEKRRAHSVGGVDDDALDPPGKGVLEGRFRRSVV
jgi:hypothetical protein